ncbi:MAG: conjugal transfer protein TrbL, partial [Chloroflexi bacterium]|nr:conjugal transfer protein TrbL [Chloroflexota bacterium]
LWLFVTLLAIEIVLFGIYYAFGAKNFVDAFWKVIFIGFWWWVVNAFPALTTMMLNSFVAWGNTAGGGGPVNILDPSAIAAQGMAAAEPITLAMENAGSLQVGRKLLLALLWLVVLLIFFIIAIQIFITVLEFYLVVALSSILLPFALLNKTKFLAEKAIGGVISFGIKLMVLAFLMTVAQPILALAVLPADPSYNQIMALVLTVGALGILVWNVPGIAAGMLAGSPSLTAGTAVQAAAIGAVGGGAAVAGGLAATRAAAALGGSAARGAANLGGGVRAGAALSSTFQTGGTGARVAGGVAGGIRGGASALTQSIR